MAQPTAPLFQMCALHVLEKRVCGGTLSFTWWAEVGHGWSVGQAPREAEACDQCLQREADSR